MLIIFLVLGWLVCATISASMDLAYFDRKFCTIAKETYRENLSMAWLRGLLFGPVSVVIVFFLSGFAQYGFMNPFVLDKYNTKKN